MKALYPVLNVFFHLLHVVVITFTLVGWIFPQTRLAHLVFILATLGSWFILGIWMGEGYCPVTDWHWKIKDALGEGRPQGTYVHLLARRLTGLVPSSASVDKVVVITTMLLTVASLAVNVKAWMGR